MPFQFTAPSGKEYRLGDIYLGVDPKTGREIGVKTDRHLILIAGARSGKGAAQIIPNAKRSPHNLLMIDPKGENLEQTWQDREAIGQSVAALDPFMIANVPERLRVSCNLLAHIDPNSRTAREDIRVIADGMVLRFKAEDGMWDNGAVSVIAGFIDYVLATHPPEERDLTAVRRLLTLPPDAIKEAFAEMAETKTATGLAREAAAIGLSDSKKNREYVSSAVDHTEWLGSPAMGSILQGSGGFALSRLKNEPASLYLVLPPIYLAEHGRFLRLFVTAAINAMSASLKGQRCLFILDEFFSLGRIEQISKAAGLMPGYGVHLWPILQDLGQLVKLYGKEGAETFFGNSDAHIFFGNTDALTLNLISARLGSLTIEETDAQVPVSPMPSYDYFNNQPDHYSNAIGQSIYEQKRMIYSHAMAHAGKPRLTPDEVRELVAKKDGDAVARSMIVFAKGKDVFNLKLAPYFAPLPTPQRPYEFPPARNVESANDGFLHWIVRLDTFNFLVWGFVLCVGIVCGIKYYLWPLWAADLSTTYLCALGLTLMLWGGRDLLKRG